MSISLQKASFLKRVSAYIFDMLIAVMLAVGLAGVFSIVFDYSKYSTQMYNLQYHYYCEVYELPMPVTSNDYETIPAEEREHFITYDTYDALSEDEKAIYKIVSDAINADPVMQNLQSKQFTLSFSIISLGIFCSHFIWYFLLPMWFKNGQTLGKKCFGLAVIRSNFVKISNPVLFIRSILGLYVMETMAPILFLYMTLFGALGIVGLITIGGIFILQIGVMIATQTNSCIHDLLSDTVVVDMASQQIFDTQEELIAYKEAQALKQAQAVEGFNSSNP